MEAVGKKSLLLELWSFHEEKVKIFFCFLKAVRDTQAVEIFPEEPFFILNPYLNPTFSQRSFAIKLSLNDVLDEGLSEKKFGFISTFLTGESREKLNNYFGTKHVCRIKVVCPRVILIQFTLTLFNNVYRWNKHILRIKLTFTVEITVRKKLH